MSIPISFIPLQEVIMLHKMHIPEDLESIEEGLYVYNMKLRRQNGAVTGVECTEQWYGGMGK